jgi:hypothetical protein
MKPMDAMAVAMPPARSIIAHGPSRSSPRPTSNARREWSNTFSKWSKNPVRAPPDAPGLEQDCLLAEYWVGRAEQEVFAVEHGLGWTGAGLWRGGEGILGSRARLPWPRPRRDEPGAGFVPNGARRGGPGARVFRPGASPCPNGATLFRSGASGLRELVPSFGKHGRPALARRPVWRESRRLGGPARLALRTRAELAPPVRVLALAKVAGPGLGYPTA